MSKQTLLLLALLIIGVSCGDREKKTQQSESTLTYKPDSNALKLNNKAVKLMGDAGHTVDDSLKSLLYDSAVIYLSQAIEIDSLYLLAYTNKAQALQRKGSLEQSLEVLYKVQIIKPDLAEAIMGQGFLLEKMGNMELADEKYRQALKAYEKRLENDPKSDKVLSDIAFLYIFLEDQNGALDEIRDLILKNPDSEQLKMMEGVIKDFDRKKFIEEY
jgi:tetratricopeptide (TPR) repeat protein